MKFGKWVVKCRIPILVLAVALLVPSLIGMIMTRINYDMLTYLPGDIDTVVGQDILMDEFGKPFPSSLSREWIPRMSPPSGKIFPM